MTTPYPGAFTNIDGKKLFIWWATPLPAAGGIPGQVMSADPLRVSTGNGSLEIVNYEWEDEEEDDLNVGQVLGSIN